MINLKFFREYVQTKELPLVPNPLTESELENEISSSLQWIDEDERRFLSELTVDLMIRWICDKEDVRREVKVAETIRRVFREKTQKISTKSTEGIHVNWSTVIDCAIELNLRKSNDSLLEDRYITSERIKNLSKSVMELRKLGYKIKLPETGGINIEKNVIKKINGDINNLARSFGCELAVMVSGLLGTTYDKVTARFNIGRSGHIIDRDSVPQLPYGFLYALAMKYISVVPERIAPDDDFMKLTEISRYSIYLLDVEVEHFQLVYMDIKDVARIMQKSANYDSVYTIPQANPEHVKEFLNWLFSREEIICALESSGISSLQTIAIANAILNQCIRSVTNALIPLSIRDVSYATGLDDDEAFSATVKFFTHESSVNHDLKYPPNEENINSSFRPIILLPSGLIVQPRSIASRAVLNASLDLCKKCRPEQWDEKLGILIEEFVRYKLGKNGVNYSHGEYERGSEKGECDAVIESDKSLIFVEAKSKVLNRKSRSGDAIQCLADIGTAVIRPLAQATSRHAFILKNNEIHLKNPDGVRCIKLNGREIEKVALVRGELGSLHDKTFVYKLLHMALTARVTTIDSSQQTRLDDFHTWSEKLRKSTKAAGIDLGRNFPFNDCHSISLFHFLLIMDRVKCSNDFHKELTRTKFMISSRRDFYAEYSYMLYLDSAAKAKTKDN